MQWPICWLFFTFLGSRKGSKKRTCKAVSMRYKYVLYIFWVSRQLSLNYGEAWGRSPDIRNLLLAISAKSHLPIYHGSWDIHETPFCHTIQTGIFRTFVFTNHHQNYDHPAPSQHIHRNIYWFEWTYAFSVILCRCWVTNDYVLVASGLEVFHLLFFLKYQLQDITQHIARCAQASRFICICSQLCMSQDSWDIVVWNLCHF